MRGEYHRCVLPLILTTSIINLLLSDVFATTTTEKTTGVCISPGGRFPPFSSGGKPPRKVSKGPRDLTLCRVFRHKTCCDVTQTHPAFLSIRRLASTGEASQECLQLWELLECSICDPRVVVQPGPPVLCVYFCDRVFQATSDAYFSMDAKTQVFLLSHLMILENYCATVGKLVSIMSLIFGKLQSPGFFKKQKVLGL